MAILPKLIILVVVIISIGVVFFIKENNPPKEKFDYGPYEDRITELRYTLEGQPGSKHDAIKYGELLNEAGDYHGAIAFCKKFQKEQNNYIRLNWITLHAYKQLGMYDSAVVEVTELIEDAPYDKDFRWWRGELYGKLGQWDNAVWDYKQCMALQPTLRRIPFELSEALEQANRGDEAILPMYQLAQTRPEYRASRRLRGRVESLRMRYNCDRYTYSGSTAISKDTNGYHSVEVILNDSVSGRFLFDQNASHLILKEVVAKKLGLSLKNLKPMIISTDYTNLDAYIGSLDKVQMDSTTAEIIEVAVVKEKEFNNNTYDGIVGLSYLSRFNISGNSFSDTILITSENIIEN